MKNDNEIDQLFKKGLSEPDIPFDESHWQKMEEKLGPGPKKRLIPLWVISACGVAAAVLIVMFLMLNNKNTKPVHTTDQLHAELDRPNNLIETTPNISNEPIQTPKKVVHQLANLTGGEENDKVEINSLITIRADSAQRKPSPVQGSTQQVMLAENKDEIPVEIIVPARASKPNKLATKRRSQFSLSVIAAPDISSSQDHISTKVSTNVGMLATYAITERLSFTTGAIYARKLYDYAGLSTSNYGSVRKAWEVDADCKVLDIPLNINYKVFNKGSNSVTLNTGISSYFMLNEKYKYINSDGVGSIKVSNLEIVNKNQHILGVANLSMSFNRQVSSQLNIGIQPFIKIPLTGLGYHDSKLQSTGIAVSLNLNLSKSSGSN